MTWQPPVCWWEVQKSEILTALGSPNFLTGIKSYETRIDDPTQDRRSEMRSRLSKQPLSQEAVIHCQNETDRARDIVEGMLEAYLFLGDPFPALHSLPSQELKNLVACLRELGFYQAAPNGASLRGTIESLERDISAIGPLPDRDMLASITANASSQQTLYLDLLAFGETHLRQLVDAEKQRILTAEQRSESASVVIDEFGTITNLLDKVRQFQDENEKLKARKLRFCAESLLRPRRLTKCERAAHRAFLVALQNELGVVRAAVKDAQQASEDSIAKLRDESELVESLILNPTMKFSEPLPPLTHKPLDYDPASPRVISESRTRQLKIP
jgi:hypothetical protein